jgi:serine-type D-Ala-D-Ala carboxypeptidase
VTNNPSNAHPEISALLRRRIGAGDFPSAVYLVAQNGEMIFSDALGDAVREPENHPASLETIYDLASLTKPLVTGFLCARLVQLGELSLDTSVANYLLEFDRPDKNQITIRQLLTHTSGLPAWRPLYILANGEKEATIAAIVEQTPVTAPGKQVIYSDLGFITLGFVLQRLTGHSIEDLARRDVFGPLELLRTFFNPELALRTGVAACENENLYERDMCEADPQLPAYSGWRSENIWGQVHDGNAFFLSGAAGHAGLFSTASDTLRVANQFIASVSNLLASDTCVLFRTNMTEGLNEARSFAWQLAATAESTAGPTLPPYAFGHTGFTGTSCWIDPETARVYILLTNRTHARKPPFANINQVRRDFHSLAAQALENGFRT